MVRRLYEVVKWLGYLATDVKTDGVHSSYGHLNHVAQRTHACGRRGVHNVGTETELSRVPVAERHDGTLCRNDDLFALVAR